MGPSKTNLRMGMCFAVSAVASLALTVVYALGGQPQLEGLLLGLGLGGLAVGLILMAKAWLPGGHFVEERDVVPAGAGHQAEAEKSFEEGADNLERRGFITKLLGAAVGALGIAAVFPIRSLGTRPGRELFETPWAEGTRLVTEDGRPVRPEEVAINGVLTVFPAGHEDAADAQTLLIRLPPEDEPPGPAGASVEGFVGFSKVCTHAGCPVGLYQADSRELFCPCHQSAFAVLEGAKPTNGPATRPLPQLPLAIDEEGYLTATGDFPEPVGPGFWSRGRG